jgi:glycosyltransferase involved in cell wall biosynthesis
VELMAIYQYLIIDSVSFSYCGLFVSKLMICGATTMDPSFSILDHPVQKKGPERHSHGSFFANRQLTYLVLQYKMIRIALVTNVPAPYRIPIYNLLAKSPDIAFQVIFCCKREPNRSWNLPAMEFGHVFLRERITTVNGRYIHNNPDVVARLREFAPDVMIIDGFNPTHLYAFAYALAKRICYVPMTDGTYESERSLTVLHRIIRRFFYSRAGAYIFASLGGRKLYESYGISPEQCFQSHLCIDNDAFSVKFSQVKKQYDFIFCGRIEEVKGPTFALEVALEVARRTNRKVKMLFVGTGSQLAMLRESARACSDSIDTTFYENATQEELPALYQSAHIFLFPTLWDPWGVVANEACAAGLPSIVSPHAGAAGELVLNNQNGFICDLDINVWAERAVALLTQPKLWQSFSQRNESLVKQYTFEAATTGMVNACRHAMTHCSAYPWRNNG